MFANSAAFKTNKKFDWISDIQVQIKYAQYQVLTTGISIILNYSVKNILYVLINFKFIFSKVL